MLIGIDVMAVFLLIWMRAITTRFLNPVVYLLEKLIRQYLQN